MLFLLFYFLQALFMTDNSSVDVAASWVLDNQDLPDLDEPFKVHFYFDVCAIKFVFFFSYSG